VTATEARGTRERRDYPNSGRAVSYAVSQLARRCKSSGSLAILTAIRRASSRATVVLLGIEQNRPFYLTVFCVSI
jgi:hypothetical protein